MANKKKIPTYTEMLKPYGFNAEQIRIVRKGINVILSHRKAQRILEGLSKTRSE